MKTQLFYSIFLITFFVVYILVLYVFNIKAFRNKYHIEPRVVTKNDAVMYKLQLYRNGIFFGLMMNIMVYAFFPTYYELLVPIPYLEIPFLKGIGVGVLIGSLLLTRFSQMQLKGAWRIGIDSSETHGTLVTDGIYKVSRNPIALGMLLSTIGLFLVTPNMITFSIIILVHLIFSIRILLEEDHLYKLHGEAYERYRNRTRKWI
ncbi:methyltransferase family protein [Aestuariivivens sediminis]|uniref:methyltransferase family protein n=1 Tax=Aestuariivivens sediminis TaxID=2913557 RepID=UPI001F56CD4C|nr:isoprenylcysteine carboxylmethyltransferase family protein [Aestuariivivens sediminis]